MKCDIEQLIRNEGLDDLKCLLLPREWDEVPFVSRLSRIDFLSSASALEKSRILVVSAVGYLDEILAYVDKERRGDVVAMVSILNWEDPKAVDPDPVIPNFWICTNAKRDLSRFRLRPGASDESRQVAAWLRSADLLRTHDVFDNAEEVTDPDLRRVYVSQRNNPQVEAFVERG